MRKCLFLLLLGILLIPLGGAALDSPTKSKSKIEQSVQIDQVLPVINLEVPTYQEDVVVSFSFESPVYTFKSILPEYVDPVIQRQKRPPVNKLYLITNFTCYRNQTKDAYTRDSKSVWLC